MWAEYFKIALSVLRTHKFRAALTVLSIMIGAFSIVLMTSLAKSGLATLASGIEQLGGARLIAVFPEKPERARQKQASYTRGLTREDLAVLMARVPYLRAAAMVASAGEKPVRRSDGRQQVTDIAAGTHYLEAYNVVMARGRRLTDEDNAARRRVCVIGHELAEGLFPLGGDPLGQELTIGADSYRVVGIAAKANTFNDDFGINRNNFLVVPDETMYPDAPGQLFPGWFIFKTDDAAHNDIAKRVIDTILSTRHRNVDDYLIFDFASALARWYKIFAIMQAVVGLLAGIALLVGGVGIMNMLLVSVRERVREIGVRKALGATAQAIRSQFLIEAAVLSLLGGGLGALAGAAMNVGAGQLIGHFQEGWVTVTSQGAIVAALTVSVAIGLGFGYVPARRAGGLPPVECLRQ